MRRLFSALALSASIALLAAPVVAQDAVKANPFSKQGASKTSLSSSPSSVDRGTVVTLSADVQPLQGGPNATGTVQFFFGNYSLGTATVSNTVANLQLDSRYLPLGTFGVTAHYSGDSYYTGSTSNVSYFTVSGTANSATSLAVSPSSVVAGYQVTLKADVQPTQGGANAQGYVLFFVGDQYLGYANVEGTVAQLQVGTAGAPAGKYGIIAVYIGSQYYTSSFSPVEYVTITKN